MPYLKVKLERLSSGQHGNQLAAIRGPSQGIGQVCSSVRQENRRFICAIIFSVQMGMLVNGAILLSNYTPLNLLLVFFAHNVCVNPQSLVWRIFFQ